MNGEKERSENERKEVTKGMETQTEMKVTPEELRGTVDYLSEVNVGKRTFRTGWRLGGPPPEKEEEQDDIAAHSYAGAHFAYILGRMEGLSQTEALECVGKFIFHDDHEIRTGERDKLATHYQEIPPEVVLKAMEDQTSRLPEEIGKEILELALAVTMTKPEESREVAILHDADILEASAQAKISHERGFRVPEYLLRKYLDPERVVTRSAKRLMNALRLRKDLAVRWLEGSLNV